jgi:glutamate dehydrogenase
MRRAIPKTLVDRVGLETLLERLPEPYQRALFSSWVASHFVCSNYKSSLLRIADLFSLNLQVYKYGVTSSAVDFFHFARDLAKQ